MLPALIIGLWGFSERKLVVNYYFDDPQDYSRFKLTVAVQDHLIEISSTGFLSHVLMDRCSS